MSIRKRFSLTTNWDQLVHSLENVLYIRNDDCETTELKDTEIPIKFVTLKPTKDSLNVKCAIKIKSLEDGFSIEAIDVICNAKHLEIFELSESYVNTAVGLRIDEELNYDEKVFILQHSFDTQVYGSILKIPSVSELHIYSIHLTVNSVDKFTLGHPFKSVFGNNIDFCNVKKLLENSPLSQEATDLLNKITEKQKKTEMESENQLSALFSSLFQSSKIHNETLNDYVNGASLSGEQSVEFNENRKQYTNLNKETEIRDQIKNISLLDNDNKNIVNVIMQKLENNMMKRIDLSLSELEQRVMTRLDRIEQMLINKSGT